MEDSQRRDILDSKGENKTVAILILMEDSQRPTSSTSVVGVIRRNPYFNGR